MIARSQRRDFAYIPFDYGLGEVMIFPKGKLNSTAIMKIATEFMGSRTNFERPLKKAVEIIKKKSAFKNADIIFVTDRVDSVSDDYLRSYHF